MFAYYTHFNTSTFFLESRLLNLGKLLTYRQIKEGRRTDSTELQPRKITSLESYRQISSYRNFRIKTIFFALQSKYPRIILGKCVHTEVCFHKVITFSGPSAQIHCFTDLSYILLFTLSARSQTPQNKSDVF